MAMQPNRGGNGSSASAGAKRLAEQKAERREPRRMYPILRRTDPAGRSGFGESAMSNISFKGGKTGPMRMPAKLTAQAASYKENKGARWNSSQSGIDSMNAAMKYAQSRRGSTQYPRRVGGY